jgi:hypothetical protein
LHGVKVPGPYLIFIDRINRLYQNNGVVFTVSFLKKSLLITQHYLSGNPVGKDPGAPRVATKAGLPLLIPKPLRDSLRLKEKVTVKVCLAILSLFRIMSYKGQLKLSTITDGPTVPVGSYPEIALVWRWFVPYRALNALGRDTLLILKTAGPNFRTSILGAPIDALGHLHGGLLNPFKHIDHYFGGSLWELLKREMNIVKDMEPLMAPRLGKLSLKNEPAGKIRVFAIVDVWTQSVLWPIHDTIFRTLKNIPQDGTFNQDGPLKLLQDKLKEAVDKTTYSYDLSAATDRFPIGFQVQVLSQVFTPELAYAWKELMVDRDYWLAGTPYRYGVGQPMGALSSWAVFALSHHLVVQLVARRIGYNTWFSDYALLGDDIVIANELVAKAYYVFMTEELGVEINLSKSLHSREGVMEFAKRLVDPYTDWSPVGAKNVLLSLKAPPHIPTLFLDYVKKGGTIEHANVQDMMNTLSSDIVKISKGKLEQLLWSISGPFGFIDSGSRFGPLRVETTLSQLQMHGVSFKISEVMDAFESVLRTEVERAQIRARDKTLASMQRLTGLSIIIGFKANGMSPRILPSFSQMVITSLEIYSNLFPVDRPKLPPIPMNFKNNVLELVQWQLNEIQAVSPLDNCLAPKALQRPRFRPIGINFFKDVNQYLEDEVDTTLIEAYSVAANFG